MTLGWQVPACTPAGHSRDPAQIKETSIYFTISALVAPQLRQPFQKVQDFHGAGVQAVIHGVPQGFLRSRRLHRFPEGPSSRIRLHATQVRFAVQGASLVVTLVERFGLAPVLKGLQPRSEGLEVQLELGPLQLQGLDLGLVPVLLLERSLALFQSLAQHKARPARKLCRPPPSFPSRLGPLHKVCIQGARYRLPQHQELPLHLTHTLRTHQLPSSETRLPPNHPLSSSTPSSSSSVPSLARREHTSHRNKD
mmetsp:Transcript_7128/g.20782  ORF Transcript_7128/g.20782 Transcript_7128/m.20782 type:complete len:252 (+) Transcript_7128:1004-1759(+)